ncbi:hypothetical protein IU500_23990 [Nocardia terpenica]|uniref:Uncharacterized protein n=1 Tax=Nocardia terpenica TaxID=455432 RepID=A0A291RFU8_9NOCA|nr:hypothetical protein [Nocardia terpenica]ATL66168.1 hypothetical protein CRH09_08035 [Nocardia terpenica]MBF6063730.1 hypothetical protein [Nocardia terpenica]MBF6107106.1 hypothetical protein [Nocardia terpenica]MBF6114279.1 hypothetical protein [Nocardia terpenica]MBF6121634.1 hypothetical protein [Nocardia terpenica]
MADRIAGKIFYAPGELPPPDPAEVAEAQAAFAEFDRQRQAVPPENEITLRPDHYGNDLDGTEYEQWARQRRADREAQGGDQ